MSFPKKDVQEKIYLSKKYNSQQRELIGKGIVERIIKRTQSGIDKNGKAFPRYNKEYAKEKGSTHVDLTLTEDMLTELDIVSHKAGEITVGYEMSNPEAPKASGNNTGKYGNQTPILSKARPFIGVTEKEKTLIIAKAEQSFKTLEQDEEKSKFLDAFVSNLIGRQGG